MPDEPQAQPHRQLPLWAWLLAAAFYPAGTFVALSAARVLRWRSGIALAVAWYALLAVGLPYLTPYLDARELAAQIPAVLLLFGFLVGLGLWQYRLGRRCGYWSEQARRIWWIFGVLVVVLLVVNLLSLIAYVLLIHLVPMPSHVHSHHTGRAIPYSPNWPSPAVGGRTEHGLQQCGSLDRNGSASSSSRVFFLDSEPPGRAASEPRERAVQLPSGRAGRGHLKGSGWLPSVWWSGLRGGPVVRSGAWIQTVARRPPTVLCVAAQQARQELLGRRGGIPLSRAWPARMSSRQELVGLLFALPFGAANDAVRTD